MAIFLIGSTRSPTPARARAVEEVAAVAIQGLGAFRAPAAATAATTVAVVVAREDRDRPARKRLAPAQAV